MNKVLLPIMISASLLLGGSLMANPNNFQDMKSGYHQETKTSLFANESNMNKISHDEMMSRDDKTSKRNENDCQEMDKSFDNKEMHRNQDDTSNDKKNQMNKKSSMHNNTGHGMNY